MKTLLVCLILPPLLFVSCKEEDTEAPAPENPAPEKPATQKAQSQSTKISRAMGSLENTCSDCGSTLPVDAPESLCPRCTFAAMAEQTEPPAPVSGIQIGVA